MTTEPARAILQRVYELDSALLDARARSLGASDWQALTDGLEFSGQDTGGGCMMLVAALPGGYGLGITDGDAGFPTDVRSFWVGIMDQEGEELLSLFSEEQDSDSQHQGSQA